MKKTFDVVVAGAGIVGLVAACRLARIERVRVTVLDGGPRPSFDATEDVGLRVSAIAPGSIAILESLGCWDRIHETRAGAFRAMRVWDARGCADGPEALRFDAGEFAVPSLGYIVENALIQDALLADLDSRDASIRFETPIEKLDRDKDRFTVVTGSGETFAAELLVGADGAHSKMRDEAGIGVRSRPYAQNAFVTHCRPERAHRETAWQRFLESGPIALLPLHDGRVSIVWSTTPAQADDAVEADDDTLSAMLTDATDAVLGKLDVAGPRGAFPLGAGHATQYVQPGLALIGDAAHSIHPLAGQGANLGIADANALADVVARAVAGNEYPGDLPTLRRYERSRRGANELMLNVVDGLNRLFSNESEWLSAVRGAGMYAFNSSGPIREQVVRVALGL